MSVSTSMLDDVKQLIKQCRELTEAVRQCAHTGPGLCKMCHANLDRLDRKLRVIGGGDQ